MNQTWENNKKPSFGADFCPFRPNLGHQFFFFSKIWLHQSVDIMVSYHHVQYQKKLMIQSWENLVTDRQTDRPNESDFIRHCPMSKKVTKDISLKLILTILKCYTNWALICYSYPTEWKLKTMKSCAHLICTTTKTTSYI